MLSHFQPTSSSYSSTFFQGTKLQKKNKSKKIEKNRPENNTKNSSKKYLEEGLNTFPPYKIVASPAFYSEERNYSGLEMTRTVDYSTPTEDLKGLESLIEDKLPQRKAYLQHLKTEYKRIDPKSKERFNAAYEERLKDVQTAIAHLKAAKDKIFDALKVKGYARHFTEREQTEAARNRDRGRDSHLPLYTRGGTNARNSSPSLSSSTSAAPSNVVSRENLNEPHSDHQTENQSSNLSWFSTNSYC